MSAGLELGFRQTEDWEDFGGRRGRLAEIMRALVIDDM